VLKIKIEFWMTVDKETGSRKHGGQFSKQKPGAEPGEQCREKYIPYSLKLSLWWIVE
jgi:hypothetical protein